MKTYVKPVAEIREFEVSNKIASLSSWLASDEAAKYGVSGVDVAAITSYYMTSESTFGTNNA